MAQDEARFFLVSRYLGGTSLAWQASTFFCSGICCFAASFSSVSELIVKNLLRVAPCSGTTKLHFPLLISEILSALGENVFSSSEN